MADIMFVAIALGFFAVCVAYVRALDRLVRSGDGAAVTDNGRPDTARPGAAS